MTPFFKFKFQNHSAGPLLTVLSVAGGIAVLYQRVEETNWICLRK